VVLLVEYLTEGVTELVKLVLLVIGVCEYVTDFVRVVDMVSDGIIVGVACLLVA
jgi:hypothetical protein